MARDDQFERLLVAVETNAKANLLAEQNELARVQEVAAREFERGRAAMAEEIRRQTALEAVAKTARAPGLAGMFAATAAALSDVTLAKALVGAVIALVSAVAGWAAGAHEVGAANADPVVEVPHAP